MSVFRGPRRRTYQYDFWYAGQHYRGNTYQENENDARLAEAKLKLKLRQQRGGIATPDPAPFITEWAETYYDHVLKMQKRTGRPKRPERIEELLRVVLRFWGTKPVKDDSLVLPADGEEAPFHGLTLQDPIDDPSWLLRWDEWIDRRNVAGGTRNHYQTTMSRLYAVAMLPEYRKMTSVSMNPFAGRPRSIRATRKVALTPERVLGWIQQMSYHARLSVAIAALAPKLRLRSILDLERANIDPDVTVITVWNHKSDRATGEPQVVPISAQLRTILLDAFERIPKGRTHLVHYGGKPVDSIRGAVRNAARAAGIPYGRYTTGGVTFHTLRHTAATLLARLGVNPWLQRDTIGHQDLATTAGYTHLQVEEQRPAVEQLSATLPIADVVTQRRRRAPKRAESARGHVRGPQGSDGAFSEDLRTLTRGALMTPGRPFRRKAQETR
jgi:integrase